MRKKSLKAWIKENRKTIDKNIFQACSNCRQLNDEDRRIWVLNDEGLYRWAKAEGVNV